MKRAPKRPAGSGPPSRDAVTALARKAYFNNIIVFTKVFFGVTRR